MKPNFFMVGAPKCGTTALSEYLRDHPNIFMSNPKELFYFAADFPRYRLAQTETEYITKFFADVESQHHVVGEASALYLCSDSALEEIHRFNPEAKIVVMLRNPVDLVYSYHSQLLFDGDENEPDFIKAWQLQNVRKQGKKVSRLCRDAKLLQYVQVGKLGRQMEHLLQVFPREQIHIIWFEDFSSSTKLVYEEVLDFLELPSDNRTEFMRVNANKTHKSSILGMITEKTPQFILNAALDLRKVLGISRWGILDAIRSFNSETTRRSPLPEDFRVELIAEFTPDIQKLSNLLDKDLSSWLN